MSFATDVKNEISLLKVTPLEEKCELSAILRNHYTNNAEINIYLENSKIIKRIYTILKKEYDVIPEIKQNKYHKTITYHLFLNEKLPLILKDLEIIDNKNKYKSIPKEYFVETEDLARAYLRGTFLATGSINDPKKSNYHLEFLLNHLEAAKFIQELLLRFAIKSKVISKDRKYMVYIKEAEKIGDFLRVISSYQAVLYFEDIRIYRDHKNMTNRFNNCEQANVDKTINASEKQIEEIDYILKNLGYELIDDKLLVVMDYRKKYPDATYNELANIISLETEKPLTKSGLNHRLRKIHELYEKLQTL